jgi:hypothetical protein
LQPHFVQPLENFLERATGSENQRNNSPHDNSSSVSESLSVLRKGIQYKDIVMPQNINNQAISLLNSTSQPIELNPESDRLHPMMSLREEPNENFLVHTSPEYLILKSPSALRMKSRNENCLGQPITKTMHSDCSIERVSVSGSKERSRPSENANRLALFFTICLLLIYSIFFAFYIYMAIEAKKQSDISWQSEEERVWPSSPSNFHMAIQEQFTTNYLKRGKLAEEENISFRKWLFDTIGAYMPLHDLPVWLKESLEKLYELTIVKPKQCFQSWLRGNPQKDRYKSIDEGRLVDRQWDNYYCESDMRKNPDHPLESRKIANFFKVLPVELFL